MDVINSFIDFATSFIANGGIILGVILIILEALIPILPLGVFVALNINAFGAFLGILISWASTCLGSYLAYLLFYFLSNKFIYKLISNNLKSKIDKTKNKFKKISFSNLVLLTALPFTPSCLINLICGIAQISKKKFLTSILIGKFFMIIFWGYVGKSLIESITDIKTIIIVIVMLIFAYLISKLVNKKMNIE